MSSNETAIVTWFHADELHDSGVYAQTLGDSSRISHADVYFDCAIVFFASLVVMKRKENRFFVLNPRGFSLLTQDKLKIFKKLEVTIIILENSHLPPGKFGKKWKNQFFILDIINYFVPLNMNLFILDSDVICISSNQFNFDSYQVLGIQINQDADIEINGLKLLSYSELSKDFFGQEYHGTPTYFGGECYGIRSDQVSRFNSLLETAYKKNLQRIESNDSFVTEEAHLVSIIFQFFEINEASNTFMNRIWTQPWTFRLVPIYWKNLVFLHLPAEKKTGIRKIAHFIEKRILKEQNLPEASDFLRYSLRNLGIPKYGPIKLFQDLWILRKGALRHFKSRVILLLKRQSLSP